MSAEYVRRTYGVDYKVGDRLTVDGKPGTLVSFPGQYLGVRLDGDSHPSRCHPTWRVERETAPTCPWCGHPDDCKPGEPGQSFHHDHCCADRFNPTCLRTEREALNRIMRDDIEREVS